MGRMGQIISIFFYNKDSKWLKRIRFISFYFQQRELENLCASRARNSIVALCAPKYPIVALRARFYILHIHLSLFLVIWYRSSSQFYNIVDVNYIFSKLLNLFVIEWRFWNILCFRVFWNVLKDSLMFLKFRFIYKLVLQSFN